jgi:hypothetical protein
MLEDYDNELLRCLQRALQGNVIRGLRQASIEADRTQKIVHVRFECDKPSEMDEMESLSVAATEIAADFPFPWTLDEQYSFPAQLAPLACVGFRRNDLPTQR